MSTYEQLRGARLKFLDQDPANATDGQVWYNSTTGKDRVLGIGAAAWSSVAPISQTAGYSGSAGSQTAGLIFAIADSPSTTFYNVTEEYNGTGWSAGGDMSTARGLTASGGTQTAAYAAAGQTGGSTYSNATEEYNGSSWTAGGNYPGPMRAPGATGSQTAAVAFGGSPAGSGDTNATNYYNGSSWTAQSGTLGTARNFLDGAGVQTAAITTGGWQNPGNTNSTEEWDGTSWTSGANNPASIRGMSLSGTQTRTLAFGGITTTYVSTTLEYDGSAWSTRPSLATARRDAASGNVGSTASATFAAGGHSTADYSITEEYNFSTVTKNPSAWSSGDAYPGSVHMTFAGTGTGTAYLKSSGNSGSPPTNPISNQTQEYDGSSWTSGSGVPYSSRDPDSAGVQTAAVQFGGQGPSAAVNNSIEYDGTSWTGSTSMNHNRRSVSGTGAQTTTITAGGAGPPSGSPEGRMTSTESYNGTSWSNETALPSARAGGGSLGVESANFRFGGTDVSPETGVTTVLEYDGSAWTTAPNANTKRRTTSCGGSGTTTAALIYGGGSSPSVPSNLSSESFDGTSFTTDASLASLGNCRGAKMAPSSTGVMAVGTSSSTAKTENYDAGSPPTVNPAQSLTTSS